MHFQKMTFKNFLSFAEEEQTIFFADNEIVLVLGQNHKEGGSNGSGKTSIFNAIVWALYGKTTKGLQADEVVNDVTGKDCRVELEFTKGKSHVRIVRWRKKNGKKNLLELYVNGESKTLANMSDTQAIINDIIKVNFRSFISSVMFSQDRIFSFTGAKEWKRKEIVENLLQVDNLNLYERLIKNDIADLKKQHDTVYNQSIGKKELVDNLVESSRNYIDSCKIKSSQLTQRIKKLRKELEVVAKTNVEKELHKIDENEKLQRRIEELDLIIQNEEERLDNLKKQANEKLGLITHHDAAVEKAQKEIDKAKQDPKLCPVCGSQIDKKKIESWLKEREVIIKKSRRIADKASEELAPIDTQKQSLQDSVGNLKEERRTKKSKLKTVELSREELNNLSDKKRSLETQIQGLEDQKKDIIDMGYIESIKEQAKTAKSEKKKLDRKLEKIQENITHYDFWAHAFSKGENTLRTFLVNKVINFINSRIKHYLDIFFVEDVNFILDKEMNDTIIKNDRTKSLEQLSGGEEQRINLAIAFSLFDLVKVNLGNDINIIFMDEVLDRNLDDKGINALLKIIDDLKERGNSIYVISHKDTFKSYFVNSMIVYKDPSGISKVLTA